MKREKARHMFMEVARRIYENENGNLKGFGKIAKFYRDDWRPDFKKASEQGMDSYYKMWNSDLMVRLRSSINMNVTDI